ncbi:hypothetical protein NW754_000304 [Fusarium falciforme]|uniref:Zn(2)-C6 fungal-type domain-containing protein n=1 Tax=Fusarium falciforme TaxID=195108 RepID=UPI0023006042|nr:Zn(2)-C6 fungal-type domain-containing protein [Fusarium falciforme]KAJ4171725.1 hypothetical protein NW754_000304 [Fusarium falciforme]KAJ4195331.1 hypothetical protein NW759_016463 [Fusarium solani]WAO97247.1 Zn(2)-C6 fungal-type domain-containing protein [Fusarium falciforme]
MNYVSVVIGIFILLIVAYWLSFGHNFQGPEMEALLGQRSEPVIASDQIIESAPSTEQRRSKELKQAS